MCIYIIIKHSKNTHTGGCCVVEELAVLITNTHVSWWIFCGFELNQPTDHILNEAAHQTVRPVPCDRNMAQVAEAENLRHGKKAATVTGLTNESTGDAVDMDVPAER